MRNTIKKIFAGKNAVVTTALVIGLLSLAGLGCGGGSKAADEKQAGSEYVGTWTSKDGSFITIRSDGSGDYKIGGTSVSGGKALVSDKDKTLRIAMLGMGSPMKIDKAPAGGEMTIDGVVYKSGGGGSSSSDSKPAPSPTHDDDN